MNIQKLTNKCTSIMGGPYSLLGFRSIHLKVTELRNWFQMFQPNPGPLLVNKGLQEPIHIAVSELCNHFLFHPGIPGLG